MIKDLRKKTDVELGELISKLKIQLLEMRFKIASGEVEGLHKISEIKKTIAMVMTILSERNIRVSFTTHTIQLIKNEKNKQEIKAIKLENLVNVSSVSNKSQSTDNKQQNKHMSNQNNMVQDISSQKPQTSSKKQTLQIRKTAKG